MKISDLAERSGISAHTLRYYEKTGLLRPSHRSESNYRIYSQDDLTSAKFIKRSKECGFSLAETATLLAIRHDKSQHVCAEAKLITSTKITDISIDRQRLGRIARGTKVALSAKLSTSTTGGSSNVGFNSANRLNIIISLNSSISID